MKRFAVFMTAAAIIASATGAGAAEKERGFSHAPAGATPYIWGNKKKEAYDVAIRVSSPALVGKRITGFTVPIATDEKITDVSGWLSSELKIVQKVNVPDITTKTVEIKPEGRYEMPEIEVVFDEPYTITEAGVYVGYSFNVSELVDDDSRYPVVVAYGESEGGCYVHTSRTYLNWKDMVADNWGMVSLMEVSLVGDFYDNAVALESLQPMYAGAGDVAELKGRLVNHGEGEVTSIDYSYTFGETTSTGHVDLAEPIAAAFGSSVDVVLPVTAPDEMATYDCTVTVTGVNGKPNEDPSASSDVKMNVIAFVPVTRPLMEEYTGTWCVWCPRGYIAMERMNHKHPGKFVGLAYHAASDTKDPMQCLRSFPTGVKGFPAAVLNRNGVELDPYYGSTNNVDMAIEQNWLSLAEQFSTADISVNVAWEDAGCTRLKATSEVKFVGDESNCDYRISYVLVGDNLTGEKWKDDKDNVWYQLNNYAGKTMEGEDWDVFTKGESAVIGLVFNDVVLASDNMRGVAGSVPSDITGNEVYEHSYTYDLSKVRNIYGEDIINDKSKLRIVAILTDGRTGKVINCNSSAYPDMGGVENAVADSSAEVVETLWHDLSGRAVANPSAGMYVRTSVMSDGSVKHDKVVL